MNDEDLEHILNKPLPIDVVATTDPQFPAAIEEPTSGDDVQDDYELARATIRELVKTSQEALEGILNLAKTSEHPRAYEVLGQMIKTTSDTAKELLEIQKQRQEVTGEGDTSSSGDTHIGNAIFVGSTNDLQTLLKQKKESQVIDHDPNS
jgi:hypothetical protein